MIRRMLFALVVIAVILTGCQMQSATSPDMELSHSRYINGGDIIIIDPPEPPYPPDPPGPVVIILDDPYLYGNSDVYEVTLPGPHPFTVKQVDIKLNWLFEYVDLNTNEPLTNPEDVEFTIYRSVGGQSNFEVIGTTSTQSYGDVNVNDNCGYYYKVVASYEEDGDVFTSDSNVFYIYVPDKSTLAVQVEP